MQKCYSHGDWSTGFSRKCNLHESECWEFAAHLLKIPNFQLIYFFKNVIICPIMVVIDRPHAPENIQKKSLGTGIPVKTYRLPFFGYYFCLINKHLLD